MLGGRCVGGAWGGRRRTARPHTTRTTQKSYLSMFAALNTVGGPTMTTPFSSTVRSPMVAGGERVAHGAGHGAVLASA